MLRAPVPTVAAGRRATVPHAVMMLQGVTVPLAVTVRLGGVVIHRVQRVPIGRGPLAKRASLTIRWLPHHGPYPVNPTVRRCARLRAQWPVRRPVRPTARLPARVSALGAARLTRDRLNRRAGHARGSTKPVTHTSRAALVLRRATVQGRIRAPNPVAAVASSAARARIE